MDPPVVEDPGFQGCRVDLVEPQPGPEQGFALGPLADQSGDGVIFDLRDRSRHRPVGRVGVAPLG